jgi:hypothetical protein
MAASGVPLPSMLMRFVVSFDNAEGDVGLRSFALSFLLADGPMSILISTCSLSDCIVDAQVR